MHAMKTIPPAAILLAAIASGAAAETPAVRVAFCGYTQGESWDLWLGSADGSHLERATVTPEIDERTPALSPDRMTVAFTTSRGDLQLYVIATKTVQSLPLPGSGRFAWPTWSADGKNLYYVEVLMGKGPDEGRIWRYVVSSGAIEKVADQPEVEGWPSVSSDGAMLFTTWTQAQSCGLWSIASPDAAPTLLWDKSLSLSGATWFPGGSLAAVASDGRSQKVLLLKNGKLDREIDVPGASGRPVAFDGSLLLTRIDNGLAGIHVMDLASGRTRAWSTSAPKDLVQMRDADCR
ncbi:MAG: PD40 domain-containing protein [Acidobacteria bacterium]|nr:PD40 domain-containing protein [Acidobacteriota bacterium]